MQNIRLLVCQTCMDRPQEQGRAIKLPADPMPIRNPRVENFANDETDYRMTSAPSLIDAKTGIPIPQGLILVTQDGQNITTQVLGFPNGFDPNSVMPLQESTKYGVVLDVLSITSTGTEVITVTCRNSHGLQTNAQVSIEGALQKIANGIFSVTVTTATSFTYSVLNVTNASSLLSGATLVRTAIVGLPYNYNQIPLDGAING